MATCSSCSRENPDDARFCNACGAIGCVSEAAYLRLGAAEQLVVEDRRAQADEQLQKELVFYRSVGATRCIRHGAAPLAATA